MLIKLEKYVWLREFYQASKEDKDPADIGFTSRCLKAPDIADCYGLELNGRIVSFSAVHFSTRPRKNAWGRYLDWHLAYTPVGLRRRGYATQLWGEIKALAIASGHARVKSIAKGRLGFYLHRSLGHQFWGWDRNGRGLIVDASLGLQAPPEGIPIEARCAIHAHLLSEAELKEAEQNLL